MTAWYVGYLTPSNEYIGMYQGLEANPTWVAGLLERTLATGTITIDGVEWTVYDNRDSGDDVGNARYGLTTEAGGSTFVLLGTATPEEFETLAAALVPTIDDAQDQLRGPAVSEQPTERPADAGRDVARAPPRQRAVHRRRSRSIRARTSTTARRSPTGSGRWSRSSDAATRASRPRSSSTWASATPSSCATPAR